MTEKNITKYRWPIMLLISITVFGSYLAYDCIGPIAPMLKSSFDFQSKDIGLLYSIYSLPNIIMVFFGGMIFDRIGSRKAAIAFTLIMFAGTLVVALAPYISIPSVFTQNKTLFWMLVGRFFFGLGSESLIVAQSAIIGRWFKGKELALAFGLNLTISRLGTFCAFWTFGSIAERTKSIDPVLWAGAILCLVSVLSVIIYSLLESKAQKNQKEEKQDSLNFSDIKKFQPAFWYICVLCCAFYSSVFPFTAFSTDFLHIKWGLSQDAASKLTSLPITMSMIISPILGAIVDKVGKRGTFMIAGSVLILPVFSMLSLTSIPPWVAMAMLGTAFSLVPSALWPAVPLITEEKLLGTAYGLITMVQNIGLTLFPFVIGYFYDKTGNYTYSMLVLTTLSFIALICSILLYKSGVKVLERGKISANT